MTADNFRRTVTTRFKNLEIRKCPDLVHDGSIVIAFCKKHGDIRQPARLLLKVGCCKCNGDASYQARRIAKFYKVIDVNKTLSQYGGTKSRGDVKEGRVYKDKNLTK